MVLGCPTVESPITPTTPSFPVDIRKGFRVASAQVVDPSKGTIRDLGDRWQFEPKSLEAAKTFLKKCPPLPNPHDSPVRVVQSLVDIRHSFQESASEEHPRLAKSPSLPASFKYPIMPGCGGCHGPCGQGQHLGSRKGHDACQLEHFSGCPGDIQPVPGRVRPCPPDYVHGLTLPASDRVVSDAGSGSGSDTPS